MSHQLTCPICGDGFDQRSRYERHLAAAHPPSALTAADVTKTLAGIQLPVSRDKLVELAAARFPPDSEVMRALQALPDRVYRDAAEVAVAFGETKAPRAARSAGTPAPATEPPSRSGGRAAATEGASAAALAKILSGIHFPKAKKELLEYARRHRSQLRDPAPIIDVIEHLPERSYRSMVDVERAFGGLPERPVARRSRATPAGHKEVRR